MILRYLILLLALTAGVVAAFQLRSDTGYVLVSYRGFTAETSLIGLIGGLAVIFLAIYYGLVLLQAAFKLPGSFRRNYERRKAEAARLSFEHGITKLFEGRWQRAEVELVRRAADHHVGHLNYLAAARAAQRIGAPDRRDRYLQLVAERAPKLRFMLLLTQAELQRERGEWTAVRASAVQLREFEPEHGYAIEILAESLAALSDHAGLRTLLAEPISKKALPRAQWAALALSSTIALLEAAVAEADLGQLKAVWMATPESMRAEAEAARCYARGLARLNADADARALIESHLQTHWDEPLVRLYGSLHCEDSIAQLSTLERWLQLHGERPALLETAGAVCGKNRLWGKAKSYLEAVVAVSPTPSAFLELARLCEQTQEPAEAASYFRRGLELIEKH